MVVYHIPWYKAYTTLYHGMWYKKIYTVKLMTVMTQSSQHLSSLLSVFVGFSCFIGGNIYCSKSESKAMQKESYKLTMTFNEMQHDQKNKTVLLSSLTLTLFLIPHLPEARDECEL